MKEIKTKHFTVNLCSYKEMCKEFNKCIPFAIAGEIANGFGCRIIYTNPEEMNLNSLIEIIRSEVLAPGKEFVGPDSKIIPNNYLKPQKFFDELDSDIDLFKKEYNDYLDEVKLNS